VQRTDTARIEELEMTPSSCSRVNTLPLQEKPRGIESQVDV